MKNLHSHNEALVFCNNLSSFWKALLFGSFFYFVFFSFIQVHFNVNDDVAMMLVSNGFLANGEPSEHLVFISVFIGIILKQLYQAAPPIPWYSLFMYGVHFISFIAIIWSILKKQINSTLKLILAIIYLIFLLRFLESLTFTMAAFNSAIASLFLLENSVKENKRNWLIFSLFFAMVAWMIRGAALKGAFLISLPWLLLSIKRKQWKVIAGYAITLSILVVTHDQLQRIYYSERPQWTEFFSYNHARGLIHQTPRLAADPKNTKKVLEHIGWSNLDVAMFLSWFFVDKEIYSKNNLQYIIDNTQFSKIKKFDKNLLGNTLKPYENYILFFLTSSLASLFLLVIIQKNYTSPFLFLWSMGIITYLILFVRLPERVGLPILLLSLLILFSSASRKPIKQGFSRLFLKIFKIICLVFFILQTTLMISKNSEKILAQNKFEKVLYKLKEINESALFINWGGALPFQHTSPFINTQPLGELTILGLGWRTHSPTYNEILQKFEISSLPEAMIKRDDIHLVGYSAQVKLLTWYYKEKYNYSLKTKEIHTEPHFNIKVRNLFH